MDIKNIEVICYGCQSKIDINNECYCEDCIDGFIKEIDDLKKEGHLIVEDFEKKIESLMAEIKRLKEGE